MLMPLDTKACEMRWSTAVRFELERGRVFKVTGPIDAIDMMVHHFEKRNGPHYQTAKNDCCAALRHEKCLDDARKSFMTAAREAGINVR